MKQRAIEELARAQEEKFVEGVYRQEVTRLRGCSWETPDVGARLDGFTKWGRTRLLLEAKLDKDLLSRKDACEVLAQAVFYLRAFVGAGHAPPTVVMVADKNECFIVSSDVLMPHTKMRIDWGAAASKGNKKLTAALLRDAQLEYFVHPVREGFDLEDVLRHAEALSGGQSYAICITPSNLSRVYEVWKQKGVIVSPPANPIERVMMFFAIIERGISELPRTGGQIYVDGFGKIKVKEMQLALFGNTYKTGYSEEESTLLLSRRDELIEDEARRFQGAFYTPEIWRNEAVKEIEKSLGSNWKEECVVWDCAAGTGNLTRDLDWGCLLSSTVERTDVAVMQRFGWGGTVFQYDFLNDGAESPFFDGISQVPADVDRLLREKAKAGKRLVFFINPPYAEHSTAGTSGKAKTGVAQTAVNAAMKSQKMGLASRQLYVQFMFQCRQIAEEFGFEYYTVALFSMPKFMCSGSYRKFREWWYGAHHYDGGFMFQASQFADVKGSWGVCFTVWDGHGMTHTDVDLPMWLYSRDDEHGVVHPTGLKQVYNSDGREASKWVREPVRGRKGVDAPQMSSGLKVRDSGTGKADPSGLPCLHNDSNSVTKSDTDVYWIGPCSNRANGEVRIAPSNWRRAVSLCGARLLTESSWVNRADEYLAPSGGAPGYEQWVNDCHVYALVYPRRNNCTAMRDVPYKGEDWQIHNHWFWRTREDAHKLLKQSAYTKKISKDCREHKNDPYFAQLLKEGLTLSPDAQKVLDLLDDLWAESLVDRQRFADEHPELHLVAWDAGVYQLKHLWRELYESEWNALKEAHKTLAARLKDGVYNFGFLK
jgi:hypothetical protein